MKDPKKSGHNAQNAQRLYRVEVLEPRLLLAADWLGGLALTSTPDAEPHDQHRDLGDYLIDSIAIDTRIHTPVHVAGALDLGELADLHSSFDSDTEIAASSGAVDLNVPVRYELVIIDAGVDGFEALVNDFTLRNSDEVQYDIQTIAAGVDGVQAISNILSNYTQLDAIHLVSHGSDGAVQLGDVQLNAVSLEGYTEQIKGWSDALGEDADLLIYGCNLAGGEAGLSLLDSLSALTQADVAASTDTTGQALLGGDWDLEYSVGNVDSQVAFSVQFQNSWAGILPTFVVDTLDDTVDATPGDGLALDAAGNTSLRAAIMEANALAGADIITLPDGTYTLGITGTFEDGGAQGDLDITDDLTIVGTSSSNTIIDANDIDRVFELFGTITVDMSNLTIQNGLISGDGGGINNQAGTLSLTSVQIAGNWVSNNGGGIFNGGDLTLNQVAVFGNHASNNGGGINHDSGATNLSLSNVTVSGNDAGNRGGGLELDANTTLQNVTITDNQTASSGGGISVIGGIATLNNTIIAGNTGPTGPDVDGGVVSDGSNIIQDGTDSSGFTAPEIGVDPMLDPTLSDNGGATFTHALLAGSPAINATAATAAPATDQRGYARDGSPDIGAFEFASSPLVNDAPSFSVGNGVLTTDIGATDDQGMDLVVQPDGRILVAGTSGGDFALARYNADGSLDTTFSTDGFLTTGVGPGAELGMSVALQSDGRIVVAGSSSNGSDIDFAVVRYNADGTLDTSFSGDGMLTTAIGTGDDWGQSVAIQADGKIVVGGYTQGGGDQFAVVRYNADGTLDTSFSGDGILTFSVGGTVDRAYFVTVQDDGKILVGGGSNAASYETFALARLNTDGTFDTSFSTDGIQTTAVGTFASRIYGIVVQADDRIVVSGGTFNGANMDFALVRYNSDGSLDTGFSGDGIATTAIGPGNDWAYSITLQADGKILAGGSSHNGTDEDFAVVRYNDDGTLDTSFNGDGIRTVAVGAGDDIAQRGIAVQADGQILVAGQSYDGADSDFALVRFTADGSLDKSFDSIATLDGMPTYTEGGAAVILDANVNVSDSELDALNGGLGNYAGASLTLLRDSGAVSTDVFSFIDNNGITLSGGQLMSNGQAIASFDTTSVPGELVILFTDSNGEIPTSVDVDNILRAITFSSSSQDPSTTALLEWTFNDGNTGAQGSGGALAIVERTTVNITPVNNAPVVATNTGPTVSGGSTGNIITTAMLNEGDVDDSGTELTYTVTSATSNGTLRLLGFALGVNDTFTQDDIDNNRVTYDHGGTATNSDSFAFSLADGGEDGATPASGIFNISVTLINVAPDLADANPVLTSINEDNFISTGDSVADIVVDGSVTDPDGAVESIAITTVDNTNGTWQYSTNDGASWINVDDGLLGTDHALLLDGTLTGALTQRLRFVPNADYTGNAVFTFRAWDMSGGTAGTYADTTTSGGLTPYSSFSDSASIVIDAVNDVPSFSTLGNQNVLEDSGPHTVSSFASALPGGGTDESGQTFTYTVGTDNPGLFLVGPAIDASGTLTYTLNSNANGTAQVTVSVTDSGGTTNGGVDTSADQMFDIIVGAVNDAPTADATAGQPYVINEGDSITFDASSSTDIDGTIVSYEWDLDNDSIFGEAGESTGVNPLVSWFTLQSFGIVDNGTPYTIGLRVTDDSGSSHVVTTTLTVNNTAPTLMTTGAATVTDGGMYTLNLSSSDPGDDLISSWTINWGDGTIETFVGNPATVTHPYVGQGFTFNILASAIDEDGTFLQNELLVTSYELGDSLFRYEGTTGNFLQQFATLDGLDDPTDVIIGPDGNLYVAGEASDNVLRYNAVTGAFIDEFVGVNAGGLNSPGGLSFGSDGNLYVSSYGTNEVLRYNGTNGAFIDVFVSSGSGGLTDAYGLTFGPDGNLYVNSFTNNNVLRYNGADGAFIETFVSASSGGLSTPEQMTFGPDGHLYIASFDTNEVLRYNGASGASMGAFVTAALGGLDRPTGLAFGPDGNLYVADFLDAVILRYDGDSGLFIDEYVTTGSGGLVSPDFINFLPEQQVTVTASNFAPTLTILTSPVDTTNEDSAVEISLADLVLAGDENDTDGTVDSFVVRGVNSGTLRIGASAGTATAWVAGTNDTIDAGNNAYWTPGLDTVGTQNAFEVVARDNGGLESATDIAAQVNVIPVNDVPAFSTLGDQNVLEDSGSQSIAGFATPLPGGGADESGQTFTYTVNNDNPGLFLVGPVINASGTLTYTLNPNANGTAQVTVSVTDSGGTANGGVETSPDQTFDIVVGAVNDVPSFSTLGDQNVLEDSGPHSIAGFAMALPGGGTDESGQTFSYTISSDNPGLFLVGPVIDASGTLTYTLNPNANGTAQITVSVTDSGGTTNGGVDTAADQTFDIDVAAVNDAPYFTLLGDQNVLENSGVHSVTGFATGSPGGGPDESGQDFDYVVSNNNPSLFDTEPEIDELGILTYDLNPGVTGIARISVYLVDSGDTTNGGVDTSGIQYFDIIVGNTNDAPTLLLSTELSVEDSEAPGLDSWEDNMIIGFGDPNFSLGTGVATSGVFSSVFDLSVFGDNSDIEGMHYVNSNITVGSGGGSTEFTLQAGDLILTIENGGSVNYAGLTTSITVQESDVFVFRPQSPGDYSNGEFYYLLDNVLGGHIHALAIVESSSVVIGDGPALTQGTFLLSQSGGTFHDNVYTYVAQTIGDGTTTSVLGGEILIDGEDGGDLNFSDQVQGIHLIEEDTTIGGIDFLAGDLLLTLDEDQNSPAGVGTTNLVVAEHDVFRLRLSETQQGPNGRSIGEAVIVFDGSNVGLDSDGEDINALTLISPAPNSVPTASNLNQTLSYLEDSVSVALNDILVSDADLADTITATLNLSDAAAGKLTAGSGNGETYNQITGVWTVTGTLAQVNAALAEVAFVSEENSSISTTITTHIEDLNGAGPADGLITLTGTAVNDIPSFSTLGDQNVFEDSGPYSIAGFATALPGGGADESGQTFSYTISSDNPGLFLVGPMIDATGTLTYTLNPNMNGTAQVTVSVTDSGGTANGGVDTAADQTFDITVGAVNDVPSFSTLGDQNVLEDSGAQSIAGFAMALPGGGVDENGQTFTYTVSSTNPGLFLVGPVIDATGTLTYTLNSNVNGTAQVTVSVTDSGGTANGGVDTAADQTFDIIVGAINDVPSFSTLGDQNVLEDSGSQSIAGFATALPGGGVDENGQTFTYTVTSTNPDLFLVGPVIDATGTLTYTLNSNVNGTAQVTVSVTDSGGTVNGGVDTAADQTFDIIVGAVNDVPTFSTLGDQNVLEDSGAQSVAGFASALPGGGVDENGQTFTYAVNTDNPGIFLVGPVIDATGTLTYTLNPNMNGTAQVTVSVTDSGGTSNGGVDTAADQTFDIIVSAINDVPSFSTLGDQNVLEDSGAQSIAGFATALPGGGVDENGQTFTYTVNTDNPGIFLVGPVIDASGTLTYTLNANVNGTAQVTVSVTDSGGTTNGGVDTAADQAFDIIVGAINDVPSFSTLDDQNVLEDAGPQTVAGFATALSGGGADESGQTFTYTVSSDNPGLFLVGPAIDATGTLTYTLNTNAVGTAAVTMSVTDSGGTTNGGVDTSVDQTFNIIAAAVNDAPSLNALRDQFILEDSGPQTVANFATALPGGGSDESGQTFTYTVSSDNPGLFLVGPVIDASGTLTYTLNANAVGTAAVTISVTDSGGTTNGGVETSADQTFNIIAAAVNDVPTFSTLGDQNVLEDSGAQSVAGFAPALPGGGVDENGQTFTYTVTSTNPGLFLVGPVIDATGTLTYTLNSNVNGTAQVTVSVTDSGGTANGGVDTAADETFDIIVGAVNDTPSFSTLGDQNVLEDSGPQSVSGFASALPGGGVDENGQAFTYTVNTNNPGIFLVGPVIDASGTLTYTLNSNANGTAQVTVSVTDSGGTANGGIDTAADQTFDIIVGAVNDVPTFSTLGDQNVLEDSGSHSIAGFAPALPGGGVDENGQTLTYTVNTDNPGIFLVGPAIDSSGTLTYTLNSNTSGNAQVTVSVTDSGGTTNGGVDTSADQTFDINVITVEFIPVATNLDQSHTYFEDSGVVALNDIVVTDNDAGDIITATLTLSNPNAGSLSIGSGNGETYSASTGVWSVSGTVGQVNSAMASVAFTPVINSAVNVTITTHVEDLTGQGPLDGEITLSGILVNDAPDFTTLGNLTVAEGSGAHSVAGFANALAGGGADEAGQTFNYLVSNDNPALFAVAPSVDANGTLTYTLNPNMVGVANITLAVTDSGGTANGGIDTSTTQTFNLVVTPAGVGPMASNLDQTHLYLEDSGPVALHDILVSVGGNNGLLTATLNLANTTVGSLSANSGQGESYDAVTGIWTITGSAAQVNAALEAVEFVPVANNDVSTSASVSIQNGIPQQALDGLITLGVTPVNDAPLGADSFVSLNSGMVHVLTMDHFGFHDDVEGDAPLGIHITSLPTGAGTLILDGINVDVGDFISTAEINSSRLLFVAVNDLDHEMFGSIGFQVQDTGGVDAGGVDRSSAKSFLAFLVQRGIDQVTTTEDGSTPIQTPDVTELSDEPGATVDPSQEVPSKPLFVEPEQPTERTTPSFTDTAGDEFAAFEEFDSTHLKFVAPTVSAPVEATATAQPPAAANDTTPSDRERIDLRPTATDIALGITEMREAIANDVANGQFVVNRSAASVLGLSVGYVSWLLRGGVLMGSLLSSLPVWRFIDPLPVFARDHKDEEDEDESLEGIIQQGARRNSKAADSVLTPTSSKPTT